MWSAMHYVVANHNEMRLFLNCLNSNKFSICLIQSVYYVRNYYRNPEELPFFKLCPPARFTWQYGSTSAAASELRIPEVQSIDEWAEFVEKTALGNRPSHVTNKDTEYDISLQASFGQADAKNLA